MAQSWQAVPQLVPAEHTERDGWQRRQRAIDANREEIAAHDRAARAADSLHRADDRRLLCHQGRHGVEDQEAAHDHRDDDQDAQQREDTIYRVRPRSEMLLDAEVIDRHPMRGQQLLYCRSDGGGVTLDFDGDFGIQADATGGR